MKTTKCEEYSAKYRQGMFDIQIGVDDTDHIVFLCAECNSPMEVIEVVGRKVAITTDGKKKDNCTWIYLVCHKCQQLGKRKFYWSSEDGKYCWQRTNHWKNKKS